ncbi:DUF4391 domain-containing protein [Caproiciproducens galactitolivorans]|nr:DUF4391 domain-containing protein [Caproiciproducens galactitolivorans]
MVLKQGSETMYDALHIPAACKVDNVIYKKLFYENGVLSAADKKLFSEGIDKITWRYSLKPDNCFVKPYKDATREYGEVELIEVALTRQAGERRIAEIIMRTIPYPMLLVLQCENQTQLWAAHQRSSQNDSEKNVLEEPVCTGWMDSAEFGELSVELDFQTLRHGNFYELYSDLVDRISIHNARELMHNSQCIIHNCENLTGEQARELLAKRQATEAKIAALRAELKRETQFNRKVEINMEIKILEKERQTL